MTETSQQEVDTVFGFGRRRTHRDLVKAELGESLEHFVQAATLRHSWCVCRTPVAAPPSTCRWPEP
ncbi:hypothetical protein ACFQ0D_29575, partial [Micromonospora zhanjiangensis]